MKSGSVRVKDATSTYGVNHRTIYGWLSRSALPGQKNSTELLRLKRVNKALLQLVGKLTAKIQKSKKNGNRPTYSDNLLSATLATNEHNKNRADGQN